MPVPLQSFVPLLGRFAPGLIGLALDGHAPAVADAVDAALRDLFGTADPAGVRAAVEADPPKAQALQTRLDAEVDVLKARIAADVAGASSPGASSPGASSARARADTGGFTGGPMSSPGGLGGADAWGSPVISVLVVAAFAAVAVVVFSRYGVESAMGQLIAGALIAKFGTVVDYWLGSSKVSSDRADQVTVLLHQVHQALSGAAPSGAAARAGGVLP